MEIEGEREVKHHVQSVIRSAESSNEQTEKNQHRVTKS